MTLEMLGWDNGTADKKTCDVKGIKKKNSQETFRKLSALNDGRNFR